MNWDIVNATLVSAAKIKQDTSFSVRDGIFANTDKASVGKSKQEFPIIDLMGYPVFPGLINCHDHLLGSYWPRVGDRRPYLNWLEWDNDLKASPVYAERQQIESSDLYQLGAYRHILCGITSVQDHIPHFVRDLFAKNLPIKLLDQYAMAHSVTSYALPWGEGIKPEHALAVEKDIPFITHCSEGFDRETIDSVATLQKNGAISRQTVLIHGIALSDSDIELLANAGSNVVWCPVSNLFMFGKTAPVKKLLEAGVNVCLGTDSPMSGSISIFEELQVARNYYQTAYSEDLDPSVFLEMLTTRAARAMRIEDSRGAITDGNAADFFVLQPQFDDLYESFMQMKYADIKLVVIDGKPVFGDYEYSDLFDALSVKYDRVRVQGEKKLVKSGLNALIHRIRASVKFDKKLDFLPVEPDEN